MRHRANLRKQRSRSDQKLLQLMATLFIAPVADPYHVDFFPAAKRTELLHVGGLMEGPGAGDSQAIRINAADRFTKGKHAIHQMQMKLQDFRGIGVGAMMAVMKQRDEAVLLLERKNAVHYVGIVPLVQQHQLCVSQFLVKKLREFAVPRLVKAYVQFWIDAAEGVNRFNGALAFILYQVGERPRPPLLIAVHFMPHADPLAPEPAQEMGVAVVPVRDQGVGKKRDFELLLHALMARAGTTV